MVHENNEKVIVGWKHNLSNGAVPILVEQGDVYYNKVKEIALKTGKAMELNYAAIDIVVTKSGEVEVMEVNAAQVVITKFCQMVPDGEKIGKEIYSKVIDKIFENEGE